MVSEINPTNEGSFYAPLRADTRAYTPLGTFVVDGESFSVRRSDDGAFHYDWTSGPNDGYGFSSFGAAQDESDDHHVASIRDFLAGIDPATGYLADP